MNTSPQQMQTVSKIFLPNPLNSEADYENFKVTEREFLDIRLAPRL